VTGCCLFRRSRRSLCREKGAWVYADAQYRLDIPGIGLLPLDGGALQFINQYGLKAFVARAR